MPRGHKKGRAMKRTMLVIAALMALTGCTSGEKEVRGAGSSATATTATEETFPDEGIPESTKPEVARKKVGDTATLVSSDTNEEVSRVQVARVKFSTGDEFNRPERAYFLGVLIKVKALADDQNSMWGDFYVLMRGHHYDASGCCPEGFKPELDYVDLNDGETAEGWLIFDVPARSGRVVLGQSFGGGVIATWDF
jgi:hypothetical protein